MQKENNQEIVAQLKQIRNLLDSVIDLFAGDGTAGKKPQPRSAGPKNSNIDFGLPERAFFNQYTQSLSGPEKFTLLVAYLAHGDEAKEIPIAAIEEHWGKMTGLLGTFNRAHTTRAKDRDLVNSTKKGTYHLRPNWRSIFK